MYRVASSVVAKKLVTTQMSIKGGEEMNCGYTQCV